MLAVKGMATNRSPQEHSRIRRYAHDSSRGRSPSPPFRVIDLSVHRPRNGSRSVIDARPRGRTHSRRYERNSGRCLITTLAARYGCSARARGSAREPQAPRQVGGGCSSHPPTPACPHMYHPRPEPARQASGESAGEGGACRAAGQLVPRSAPRPGAGGLAADRAAVIKTGTYDISACIRRM